MNAIVMYLFLANQQKPMADFNGTHPIGQTAEPPLHDGPVPPPIVYPGGFVPYHLIPKPRFPIADAVVERVRFFSQNRPRLLQR